MFNLGAFLSYVFVVSFTPGPNNIMSMANASKFGYKKTLNFLLGIATGFFVIMMLCSYFNLILFDIMPKVKVSMGLLGAGYMTYLAIKITKSKEWVHENNDEETVDDIKGQPSKEEENNLNSFITGMTMQFVNPKVILYGITVLSTFIIPYYNSNFALTLISLFFALVAFISISCWALFGSLLNKFLSTYRRPFNIVMGLLLIYSALSISGVAHFINK